MGERADGKSCRQPALCAQHAALLNFLCPQAPSMQPPQGSWPLHAHPLALPFLILTLTIDEIGRVHSVGDGFASRRGTTQQMLPPDLALHQVA